MMLKKCEIAPPQALPLATACSNCFPFLSSGRQEYPSGSVVRQLVLCLLFRLLFYD